MLNDSKIKTTPTIPLSPLRMQNDRFEIRPLRISPPYEGVDRFVQSFFREQNRRQYLVDFLKWLQTFHPAMTLQNPE
jgi:hypothetical protein